MLNQINYAQRLRNTHFNSTRLANVAAASEVIIDNNNNNNTIDTINLTYKLTYNYKLNSGWQSTTGKFCVGFVVASGSQNRRVKPTRTYLVLIFGASATRTVP